MLGADLVAELASPVLRFHDDGCPDCGERHIELPSPLPKVGDDFDWQLRDYDGYRRFMLQELVARFPERTRWTAADMEMVLVELLASALDQLSDMLDRISAEAYLETARRPESVRRLLSMIGYDAVEVAKDTGQISGVETGSTLAEQLDGLWLRNPHLMDKARSAGPRSIHTQHRMVTTADYSTRMEDHPLVERAHARSAWTGAWPTMFVTLVGWEGIALDDELTEAGLERADPFRRRHDLPDLPEPGSGVTLRTVLRPYVEALRMVGREVVMEDAVPVPVMMSLSIGVADNFFQSEVRQAVDLVLGTGAGGFFHPGRLRFGEDLFVSDIIEVLMAEDGVATVCLNRFKRLGSQFPDEADAGRIVLEGTEIAVCDNDATQPQRGYYRLFLHGGRKG